MAGALRTDPSPLPLPRRAPGASWFDSLLVRVGPRSGRDRPLADASCPSASPAMADGRPDLQPSRAP